MSYRIHPRSKGKNNGPDHRTLPPGRFVPLSEIMAAHRLETQRIARHLISVFPRIGVKVTDGLLKVARGGHNAR